MPIKICPRCNRRYIVGFDACDYIHECDSGNDVLDQEDVVIVGDWEDFDGSGTRPAQEVTMAGLENEFFGTRAGVEGEDKNELTRRGHTAATRRQRQHLEFINLKDGK